MAALPVIVYPPTPTGGRRVRIDGAILGIAYNDDDLIEFLRRAGAPEPEEFAYSAMIEWRGGQRHHYGPA